MGSFARPRQTVPDKDGSKRQALRLSLAAGKGERNMSDNWVVQNLENALATWNEKLAEIWQLITQSPETFKGGTIWNVVLLIHDTMQAIALRCWCCFLWWAS